MNLSVSCDVQDQSHVAHARRLAASSAAAAQLGGNRASDLAIVVTELATNLIKHAGRGVLILQASPAGGVDVLSLDQGAGIANVQQSLQDGYSTAGSPGTGLGAVTRLASQFDLYSQPGRGTAVYARVAEPTRSAPADVVRQTPNGRVVSGGVCVALPGESACGDCFSLVQSDGTCTVFVADGLGHGPIAAQASDAANAIFAARAMDSPEALVSAIHDALRSTRGAAIAVARIDFAKGVVRYCGLGNIVGAVVTPQAVRRMVSHNGTAGQGQPRVSGFAYPWEPASTLVMHTDGLQTRWDLQQYPGLMAKHPILIAAVLYRDFARGRDDAAVLAARSTSP